MHTTTLILAAGLAVQQAAATFGWKDAGSFKCPSNTPEKCTPKQNGGYDFEDQQAGPINSYGGLQLSGYNLENSFGSSFGLRGRDLARRTRFKSKCITGHIKSEPKISCSDNSFSIGEYGVTADQDDCDVEFEYEYDDGSKCKHTSRCGREGTIIKNNQCGGARSVTAKKPKHGGKDCNIGIHTVSFHCGTPTYTPPPVYSTSAPVESSTPYTPPVTSTYSAPESSYSAPESSYSAPESSYSTPAESSSSSAYTYGTYATESSSSSAPAETTSTPITYVSSTVSTVYQTTQVTVTSCGSDVPYCGSGNGSATTYVVTSTIPLTTTVCPVTVTSTPAPSSAPAETPSYSTEVSSAPPATTTPYTPIPEQCPGLLPKCLNTWIFKSGCKDNTDSDCYCPKPEFIKNVVECVDAYGASDSEVAGAVAYMQGICAPYIPQNPAIVTCVPATITATPILPSQVTTITVSTGSINTVVTVPQVVITTYTGGPTPVPGVVAGTPPAAPAAPTGASVPGETGSIPAGSSPPASTSPITFSNSGNQVVAKGLGIAVAVVVGLLAL